jgi:uncharacterized protein (DUF1800 family)
MRTPRLLTALACTSILTLVGATSGAPRRLSDRERALHVLNRLAFGPRPGDVDRVLAEGVDVWIDRQLRPDALPDRTVETRLNDYPTLKMPQWEIWNRYYQPVLDARRAAKAEAAAADDASMKKEDAASIRKELREKIPQNQRPQHVVQELSAQRIIRAADSERQLNEVMVDFWMNHFNVFAGKGVDSVYLTSYERDAIRPHIWGRFEDLLMATAKSPAMLFYLDNARSFADPANRPGNPPRTAAGFGRGGFGRRGALGGGFSRPMAQPEMRPRNQSQARGGLNENYAREIMELHTLGVDGGYTQKDVTELARVLTGWSIGTPQEGGGFVFRERLHDVQPKTVLGIQFPAGGGIEEGEKMIHVLAHRPSTAHHIAYELCQRLIADDPPGAAVDRVTKRFLDTDGDLRQTVKAVIDSPEFWDRRNYRAKVKSPFQYSVSAIRATNATVDDPMPIARALNQMGEGLYLCQPPTGYSNVGSAWINTGALISRLNFALAMAAGRMPGTRTDVTNLISPDDAADARRSVDALAESLTGGSLTGETKQTIESRISERKAPAEDPWDNTQLPMIAGLILGSPEFQRH